MIPISLLPAAGASIGGTGGGGASTGGAGGGVASGSPSSPSLDDEVVIVLSGTAYESSGMFVCMSHGSFDSTISSSPSHYPLV